MIIRWKKQGQIFNPKDGALPLGCTSYAQSPQAMALEDCVRVYFSTRALDTTNGKFLSHVAFADFSKDFSKILRVSQGTVLPLGDLGCFDEHGIFPFSPFVDDNGRIFAYSCGWSRRKSVSVETATGLSESFDGGVTFQKVGAGQVFGATLHEPFLVGDSFVRKYNGLYHMWYMFGQRWVRENENATPDRVYKIGHATSTDGVQWTPTGQQIIPDRLHDNECQALPSVLYHGGLYHMVFCYRDVFGFREDSKKAYRIGYAWSHDLTTWNRRDDAGGLDVSADGWDSQMTAYPHIFENDGKIYLLYNGNGFGRDGFGLAVAESITEFSINRSSPTDILSHFDVCRVDFKTYLAGRVSLADYAEKLNKKATRFELWVEGNLVGLVAAYINAGGVMFISNVSIATSFEGMGLAKGLIGIALTEARKANCIRVELEVLQSADGARALYHALGFLVMKGNSGTKTLSLGMDL